jgi:hypothetical protein
MSLNPANPNSPASVVVLIPVYKHMLDALEQFSIDHSLASLHGRDVRFIAPERLDNAYYKHRYPRIPIEHFAPPCFESIPEYNRLLLSAAFYERYIGFEFMLVLQTDAIVMKDDLDYWCAQPFDYVGAPWPKPFELFVNTGRFEGSAGRHVRATVGNGGFSLRRIAKCQSLLVEFAIEVAVFQYNGSSEDLFFAVMGNLSNDFVIPNEVTASRFSMEGWPSYYQRINGGHLPMGGHAWTKNEVDFWCKVLDDAPNVDRKFNRLLVSR